MKVIIDLPEGLYTAIKAGTNDEGWASYLCDPVRKGLALRQEVTNGGAFCRLFPFKRVTDHNDSLKLFLEDGSVITVDRDWWDAMYAKEGQV